MPFEVVCCIALNDALACNYLTPLAQHPEVTRIWIVRSQKIQYYNIPKAEYVIIPTRFKLLRFIQMVWASFKLARRKEVQAFVSFNTIPYGLIQYLAAKWYKKPIHFGFIGSDWYIFTKERWWKRWLLSIFRKVDLITATGKRMQEEMLQHGLPEDKIGILPHSVDLRRYPVTDSSSPQYTCIFVGNLIKRKRVDLILRGFAEAHNKHPETKLCIVGDGPLAEELRKYAADLGITSAVDFVGFAPNVQPYLANSKIILIASEVEGLPFAMIEGICCGLVPISTPVGTINDLIIDGKNGLLFPRGDWKALATSIERLLDEPDLYKSLRMNVLGLRDSFSYDTATAVWDVWISNSISLDGRENRNR